MWCRPGIRTLLCFLIVSLKVENVLDMLHISANRFGAQDLLGSELTKQEKKRTHPALENEIGDNEMVAWHETSNHPLKHGKF